jgi:hypothetical protein
MAGGAGICFALFKALGFWWSAVPIVLIAGFALSLTFYRPNDKPFIYMLEAFFKYSFQSKLYIWERRKNEGGENKKREQVKIVERVAPERLNSSKLRDLAWSLDVLDQGFRNTEIRVSGGSRV